jgi:lysophospholipase L1-like esterase
VDEPSASRVGVSSGHELVLLGVLPGELEIAKDAREGRFVDHRAEIAAYNRAYLTLPKMYPNNVKLVDMWTPMVDTNGWGLSNMFLDGVHPGSNGWDLVMGTIRDALYSNLPK